MNAHECVVANPIYRANAVGKKSGWPLGLFEGGGGPLTGCVAGANLQSIRLLAATLDAIVVERPRSPICEPVPSDEEPQHGRNNGCLDK